MASRCSCSGCLRVCGPLVVSGQWRRRLRLCTGLSRLPAECSLCRGCWRHLVAATKFRRLCRASARTLRNMEKESIKKEENPTDVKFELFNQGSKNDWDRFEDEDDFNFNSDGYHEEAVFCDFKNINCENVQLEDNLVSKTEENNARFQLELNNYANEEEDHVLSLINDGCNLDLEINLIYKCEACYDQFPNEYLLENHLKEKHFEDIARNENGDIPLTVLSKEGQIFYKCLKCNQEFLLFQFFEEHLKQHYENFNIAEQINQFSFNPNESKLDKNIEEFQIEDANNSSENLLPIKMNEIVFLSQPDHFVIQKIEKQFVDRPPKKKLVDKNVIKADLAKCKFCFKNFPRSSLLKHVREFHPETLNRAKGETNADFSKIQINCPPRPLLKCPKCGKQFKLSNKLDAHVRQHYGLKPFVCQICYKELSNRKTYRMHMNRHNGEKNYVCDVCDKIFAYPTALEMHKRIHLGIKKYVCKECNTGFTQSSHLKNHIKTHSSDRLFKCDFCQKSFKTLSILKCHIERHKGLRNYVCSVCGKSFLSSGELTKHVQSHSNEKSFLCTLCNSVFKTRRQLSEHNRRHTGERPFKCDICAKEFMTSQVLKRHHMIHTGVKPHVCHLCNNAYAQKYMLSKHLETHKQNLQGICFET